MVDAERGSQFRWWFWTSKRPVRRICVRIL